MEPQKNQEPPAGFWSRESAVYEGQYLIWSPVFLGVGIGLYFSLLWEPPLLAGFLSVLLMGAVLFWARNTSALRPFLVVLVLLALGFAAAQLRAHYVYAPILKQEIKITRVEGDISTMEDLDKEGHVRAVLSHVVIEKLKPDQTPRHVRLRIRGGADLKIGQRISVLAGLNPPSAPAIPGGYDFARNLYFEGIGAVGFSFGKPEVIKQGGSHNFMQAIENFRNIVGDRMIAVMGKREGALAQALLVGKRGAIAPDDDDALRYSGLYHILSISGLHIALFSGVIFFVVRLGLAAIPFVALRLPIKKIAAVMGFAAAIFYMLLAGPSYPTQRSVVMTGLVYLAIMLDRFPFSMRLIAVAAFVLLLLMPESLVSASFQMSFAAVLALIAFFERTSLFWQRFYEEAGIVRRIAVYVLSLGMTSVVATLATSPYSLFHFQQAAVYGVAANFIVVPLMGFFIMPLSVVLLVLMPLGWDFWVLKILGFGMRLTLDTAHMVSSWPHAVLNMQAWPMESLILFTVAGIMILLLRRWHGVLALVPLLIGVWLCCVSTTPDILVSQDFRLIGIQDKQGRLHVNTLSAGRFERGVWERALNVPAHSTQKFPKEGAEDFGLFCAEMGCRWQHGEARVSIVYKLRAVDEECRWADVVIALAPVRLPEKNCAARHLDRYDGRRSGVHSIRIVRKDANQKPDFEIVTTQQLRGQRLWSQSVQP